MPLRPARRAAATLPPPHATIGPPGVRGGGVTWMRRPSCSKGSPVLAFSRIDELLVGDLPAPVVVDPEHLVLDGAIADRGHVRDPAAADDVEHRHLLGQLHRVVEREQHHGDVDHHGGRAGGHRAGEGERRREVAVLGRMVLADDGDDAATGLAPGRHLDGGLVEIGRRGAGLGRPHVESHHEHSGTPGVVARPLGRVSGRTLPAVDAAEDGVEAVGRCRPRPGLVGRTAVRSASSAITGRARP